jgi:thymidylate kinase
MTARKQASRGLWIAFFGPDGVGKSAVIDHLNVSTFRSMTRFHFRPRFRRTELARPATTAPHAKPPRGTLISIGKLLYWLADCWFGYLVTILPRTRSGGMVVFDRYLSDILVDPLRYRLPARLMHFLALLLKLVPRPDLCVLLDAPADVMQYRKQEVSPWESERQRSAYLQMFDTLPSKLLVDANSSVSEVARRVTVGIRTMKTSLPSN